MSRGTRAMLTSIRTLSKLVSIRLRKAGTHHEQHQQNARSLVDYWERGYDWRRFESELNRFPNS